MCQNIAEPEAGSHADMGGFTISIFNIIFFFLCLHSEIAELVLFDNWKLFLMIPRKRTLYICLFLNFLVDRTSSFLFY